MDGRNAWEGFFPVVLGGDWGKRERERERDGASAADGCRPNKYTQKSNQVGYGDGVGVWENVRQGRNVQGIAMASLWLSN
jgi:hypothetical protein